MPLEKPDAQAQAHMEAIHAEKRYKQARAEELGTAMEKLMIDSIAEGMKNEDTKKNLGKEGLDMMKRGGDPVKDAVGGTGEKWGGKSRDRDWTGQGEGPLTDDPNIEWVGED